MARREKHGLHQQQRDSWFNTCLIFEAPPEVCLVYHREKWMDVYKVMLYEFIHDRAIGGAQAALCI